MIERAKENNFDMLWALVCDEDREIPLVIIKLIECVEPNVDQYDFLVKKGPFHVHLFHANLSIDPMSKLQAFIICDQ